VVTWILLGLNAAAWLHLRIPEREVSSYLRKFVLLVCAVMYINGGISKLLNHGQEFGGWARGEELAYYLKKQGHQSVCPWLAAYLAKPPWCSMVSFLTLIFELPLTILALVGGSDGVGYSGCWLLRAVWVCAGLGFHFGTWLVMEPDYNVTSAALVFWIADPFRWGRTALNSGVDAKTSGADTTIGHAEPSEQFGQDCLLIKALLSACNWAILLAWLWVGLFRHFPNDDPKWPISSVPMYSMSCGICKCPESYRGSTIQIDTIFSQIFVPTSK
jgi:hypothetical protein